MVRVNHSVRLAAVLVVSTLVACALECAPETFKIAPVACSDGVSAC